MAMTATVTPSTKESTNGRVKPKKPVPLDLDRLRILLRQTVITGIYREDSPDGGQVTRIKLPDELREQLHTIRKYDDWVWRMACWIEAELIEDAKLEGFTLNESDLHREIGTEIGWSYEKMRNRWWVWRDTPTAVLNDDKYEDFTYSHWRALATDMDKVALAQEAGLEEAYRAVADAFIILSAPTGRLGSAEALTKLMQEILKAHHTPDEDEIDGDDTGSDKAPKSPSDEEWDPALRAAAARQCLNLIRQLSDYAQIFPTHRSDIVGEVMDMVKKLEARFQELGPVPDEDELPLPDRFNGEMADLETENWRAIDTELGL